MTPQERDLVTALFERLSALENNPRDPEAERLMSDGLARAPHAIYPLVQTVLLQDEALKRANARIEELEGRSGEEPSQSGSFLDSLRGAFQGRPPAGRGSVPSVRPGSVWNNGQNGGPPDRGFAPAAPMQTQSMPMQPMAAGGAGGSFLGTAAAAAVGMIGGSLLFNGIRGLMGGGHPAAFGSYAPDTAASPWGGNASGGELAREAGAGDIGRSDAGRNNDGYSGGDTTQTAGLYDRADDSSDDDSDDFANSDFGDDGSDVA
jgi:hypothetical protein